MTLHLSTLTSSSISNLAKYTSWWDALENQWKQAFNEAIWQKGPISDTPNESEFDALFSSTALRFMGPKGHYPNMSFELTNLSGIKDLNKVEILIVCFHHIKSIEEVSGINGLLSLYLYDNQVTDLKGIEDLINLRELYVQNNEIPNMLAIEGLHNLEKLYVTNNTMTSLAGLTKKHVGSLREFYCMPNEALPDSEILRIEQELRIRCLKA